MTSSGPDSAPAPIVRRQLGFVSDPVFADHDPGPDHPESPRRWHVADEAVRSVVAADRLHPIPVRPATEQELLLCHSPGYLAVVKDDINACHGVLQTGDTNLCSRSLHVALRAVGGVLNAVDAVCCGRVRTAFCAVRPPGHHASRDRGMGFCIFNNAALAARYAQSAHGLNRILIVDWDVHHGNGTQDIFLEDPSVLYFSTHQWPLYPGTGRQSERGLEAGRGATLNCPLAAGSTSHDLIDSFRTRLRPAAKAFKPDLVVISAGFDAGIEDPIGGLHLNATDFGVLTRQVVDIARQSAGGRVVSTLEGGYRLSELAACVQAHITALAEA